MNSIGMAVLIGLVAVFAMLDSRLLSRSSRPQSSASCWATPPQASPPAPPLSS